MWIFANEVWSSVDGINWDIAAYANPWWMRRYGHTSVVFDDKMWVLGGGFGADAMNDVWYSPDGENWAAATLKAPWSRRYYHASVVHDGKMWVTGGYSLDERYGMSDVWCSEDGRHWTTTTLSAPWGPRYAHVLLSLRGHMIVVAGAGYRDSWYSQDGTTWTLVTPSPGEGGDPSVIAYRDEICTFLPEERWRSTDKDLVSKTDYYLAPWGGRWGHTMVVYDDKVWMLGGTKIYVPLPLYELSNDVWCFDGSEFTEVTPHADWPIREQHTSVVFKDRIWVLGGRGLENTPDYMKNDIWYTTPETGARVWERYR